MTDDDDPVIAFHAATLGVAQRRVVLALSDAWSPLDDHRTAKRMTAVRDARGLIERRGKAENSWRLTATGLRVRALLDDETAP